MRDPDCEVHEHLMGDGRCSCGPDPDHELKVATEFFDALEDGRKPFEVRKDDRGGFKVGQVLWLREVNILLKYTGRSVYRRITFVLKGWGVEKGYVCLGLSPNGRAQP